MASLTEALDMAFDLYAAGRFAEAAELSRRILAAAPGQPAAAQVAGAALAALGRVADAAAAFRLLLVQMPAAAAGWSNLGNLAFGNGPGALAAYRRAAACDPLLADASANRAALLTRLGRRVEAAAAAKAALRADPAHAGAAVNLVESGLVESGLGESGLTESGLTESGGGKASRLVWARRAALLAPGGGAARLAWAAALAEAGRLQNAVEAARDAAALDPARVETWATLALASVKLDDLALSDRALARAATLDPAAAAKTAVSVCLTAARPEAAIAWADRALATAPNDAGLRWNRATALLQAGRWAEGWRDFEARRRDDRAEPPWRNLDAPGWDGAPFPGKRLLLYAEQGLGDALQMFRFIPLAAALGGEVILEVQPPLLSLARRLAGPAAVLARGEPLPPFDLECPLMSLPGLFGATPDHLPGRAAGLGPDPALAARWRHRLGAADGAPKVGLVWAGNPRFPDDARRSPGLAALRRLFADHRDARFFILQMGDGRRELAGADLPDNVIDLGAEITDLDDTLAIMAQLDVMISSCTLPAHIAAAAGTPLWLLLSYAPDWRWLLGREDTPWHPQARLFRQPRPGDWASPVRQLSEALAAFQLT